MATRTWSGATNNNWSNAGNWDTKPTTGDDVVMANAVNCVVDEATAALNSLNMTGYTGTLSGSNNITVTVASGTSTVLFAGTSPTWSGTLLLNPATGTTINLTFGSLTTAGTCGGITIAGTTTGMVNFLDGITLGATKTVILTSGTLHTDGASDTAGLTHSWGLFSSSNTNTRALILGTSTIGLTGTGNAWDLYTATGLTLSAASSTINLTGVTSGFRCALVTAVYGTVNSTGSGIFTTNTSVALKFTNFTRTGTAVKTDSVVIKDGFTVTGNFTITGNSATNRLLFTSDVVGAKYTLTLTGATISTPNADFRDITFARATAGALDLTAGGTNSVGDCGGNTKTLGDSAVLAFTTPATQNFAYGGSNYNWSTAGNWTSRVPLPQDNVTFATVFASGQTITGDMPRLGKFIDFSGASASGAGILPIFNKTVASTIYGGLNLTNLKAGSAGYTGNFATIFESQARTGTLYLTNEGHTFPASSEIDIDIVGATLTLADSVSATTSEVYLKSGTLNLAGFTWNGHLFSSNYSAIARNLIWNGSSWYLSDTGNVWLINSVLFTNTTTGGGKIYVTDTGSTQRTMAAGTNLSYAGIDLYLAGGTGVFSFNSTGNTWNVINATAPKIINFGTSANLTTISDIKMYGAVGSMITLRASAGTTVPPVINKVGGGAIQTEFLDLQGVNVTPANSWFTGNHSNDGKGVNFGGQATAGDYVSAPNSATANQMYGTTNFSLETWFIPRGLGGGSLGRLFDKTDSITPTKGYYLRLGTSNYVTFGAVDTSSRNSIASSQPVVFNALNHIVITWTTGTPAKIYVNNVETTYSTSNNLGTPADDSTTSLLLGNAPGSTRTLDGVIFASRLYRGVNLSSANVTTLYNAGYKAVDPLGNATSEYLFNEGAGGVLTDRINVVNGTIVGATWANTGWVTGGKPNFFG